ncbi:MAG TPA: alkaline phosphatase family protein [Vicinamibacterales bacterium]|nr:alkaline phosphatase family protein [Vicinamibacterales bacterium]
MRKLVLAAALVSASLWWSCSGWPSHAYDRQIVIIGFDGMDPDLARAWMRDGRLPNLAALAAAGGIYDLETTPSPESAIAWTSFATGMNPGKHNVYDTSRRDPQTYRSSPALATREPATFLFDYIPVAREQWTSTRAGATFWSVAGNAGVRSSILGVPGTFPPEDPANSELLSGTPLPDIRNTSGTFHYFATNLEPGEEHTSPSGSIVRHLVFERRLAHAAIVGPLHPITGENTSVPFTIGWNHEARSANVEIAGSALHLREGEWSRWIELDFRVNALARVRGMTQLLLIRAGTELQLYVSPVNWHPASPPAAISSPPSFAAELYERLGPYRTLGHAAASAALDEERIEEAAFLEDADRAFQDRAETILHRVDTGEWNLIVGVIDTLDRVQHMMWRFIDRQHPRYDAELARRYGASIQQSYQQADEFVGKVLERVGPETIVMIVSDHGFHPFRSTVSLNAWLVQNGYMALADSEIDWSRTRAYATVSGHVYVNLQGREGQGIVAPGAEYDGVVDGLTRDLMTIVDPHTGAHIVRRVSKRADIYRGPFVVNAPDVQVGFAPGYRAEAAALTVTSRVVEPNRRKWSGDHVSADPQITAGVLITNATLPIDAAPRLIDLAPTVLRLFDVAIPADIDGRPLIESSRLSAISFQR